MPFMQGKMVSAPNFSPPRVLVTRPQWAVLGMLLLAIALEFIFSPYWHNFINSNGLQNADTGKKVYVTNEGFMVVAFLLFAVVMILLLTGVMPRAGYAIAGLLLLSVVLARATPIIDWLDATTATLKKASGS